MREGDRLGPYEIVALLGSGGMGEVYRAHDERLKRDVAIKVLPSDVAADGDRRARFEREAQAAAQLSHPNITAVYDVGVANGTPFIVSELLAGRTLGAMLAGGPIPQRTAVQYATQIALGLAAAHEHGIAHRDLKPDNVFVTGDGRVKLLDFGIARLLESTVFGPSTALVTAPATHAGTIVGTPAYMAPEQVRGEPVDHRCDIFSLGAVVYEMLSGTRLFQRATPVETMTAVLRDDPPALPPAAAPPALGTIVTRCLAKNPSDRFQSARDLAFALESLTFATTTTAVPSPARRRPQFRTQFWVAGMLLTALTAAATAWLAAVRTTGAASSGATFRQLTFDSGEEAFPNISPDGSLVVYAANATGRFHIYLRDVNVRSAIDLTPDATDDGTQPALSRDGAQIAFRSSRDGGGIFVIGRTGGAARRLARNGFNPTWSPDGKQIAVATESVDAQPEQRSGDKSQIVIVDVVTSLARTLRTDDAVQPSWSPHGYRIAYWGLWNRSQRDIWTIGVDGTPAVRVTDDAALDWNPVWSPDGRWLYFCSDRGGSMNLWRVRVDERSGAVSGAPEPIVLPASWAAHVSLARDGRLAYASYLRSGNVERIPFDPHAAKLAGPPEAVTSGSNLFTAPQLSHDGRYLTFVGQSGSGRNIFVSGADGRIIRQVTTGGWRDLGPVWSPDDSKIAFYSSRLGRYQIFTIGRDGGELRQVSDLPGNGVGSLVWSPEGRWIAAYEPVTLRAFLIDLAKPQPDTAGQLLPEPPGRGGFIPTSWSADGAWLTGQGGHGGILAYSMRDGSFRPLSGRGLSPRWVGRSHQVLFTDGDSLTIADADSGEIRPVGRIDGQTSGWMISADGRWIYRSRISLQADLWLMTPR